MGHVWSKTRSLVQILEKPCVRSRGHIFSLILMKLGQYVCLYENLDKSKDRSCLVKNLVTSPNLRKPCVRSRGHIFSLILMKLGQYVCLYEILDELKNSSCQVKN